MNILFSWSFCFKFSFSFSTTEMFILRRNETLKWFVYIEFVNTSENVFCTSYSANALRSFRVSLSVLMAQLYKGRTHVNVSLFFHLPRGSHSMWLHSTCSAIYIASICRNSKSKQHEVNMDFNRLGLWMFLAFGLAETVGTSARNNSSK